METQWMSNPLWLAVAAGIGVGLTSAARRFFMAGGRKFRWSQRLRSGCGGGIVACCAGSAIALLIYDRESPHRTLGYCWLVGLVVDLTTAEGLAAVARVYLRVAERQQQQSLEDENTSN